LTARRRAALLSGALLVLFGAVVVWAWVSVERPSREGRVLPFAPSEVQEVRLTGGGADARLVRGVGGWTVAAPEARPADPRAVDAYLEGLCSIRSERVVEHPNVGLAGFGLDPAQARLTVDLFGGRTLSVEIGSDNPFDHTRFARAGGEVLVLSPRAAAALVPDPSLLRGTPTPDGGNRG